MDILTSFSLTDDVIDEVAARVTREVIDDLYVASNDMGRLNIFFNLHYMYTRSRNVGKKEIAAHICFVISYYLFVLLTPPHSEEIALQYANEAVDLDNRKKYTEWISFIKKGN